MATIEIQEMMLMALVVFFALKYRQAKRKFRMKSKNSKVKKAHTLTWPEQFVVVCHVALSRNTLSINRSAAAGV
jgi:hypothetical protein